MAVTDGELVDRMAKRHSVSPAAVQVVLAALWSGGGRMAEFSHVDFGGMSAVVAGHVHGGRHVQYAAQGEAGRAMHRYRGPSGLVRGRRRWALRGGRGQLPVGGAIVGLVAGRTRIAGSVGAQNDFVTQSFQNPTGWQFATAAPSRSTTPAITGSPSLTKLKAATERSRSPVKMVWSGSPTCRKLPAEGCSAPTPQGAAIRLGIRSRRKSPSGVVLPAKGAAAASERCGRHRPTPSDPELSAPSVIR
jgi:hypothetical protein